MWHSCEVYGRHPGEMCTRKNQKEKLGRKKAQGGIPKIL